MEAWQLKQMQSLPLEVKILKTQQRIREWYEAWEGQVYVSFSGGKDSTVLLKLIRDLYPDVPAVFIDTGLEYPEIREFVKTIDGVVTVKPHMPFNKVIEHYGYPVISKLQSQYLREVRETKSEKLRLLRLHGSKKGYYKISDKWKYLVNAPFKISEKCCRVMKKQPAHIYEKATGRKPYLGIMAEESQARRREYEKQGCNIFNIDRPKSTPMGFWVEQDVLEYITKYKLPYSRIYGEIIRSRGKYYTTGEVRTGCMFCMYGVHLEKGENRFQRMSRTHPKQYDYCINKMGLGEVLDYIGVDYRRNNLFG